MKRLISIITLGLAIVSANAGAQAAFPDKPVRIVVSAAPGGGTDIVARLVAQELGTLWKQPVVVENKTGAGGNIAGQFVARAKPDGYTLLVTYSGAITMNQYLYADMGLDPHKDLAPVTNLASSPMYLVVNPSQISARTLKDFLSYAKASPDSLTWGSTAKGSADHLAGATFGVMTNINLTHVPYKGGADALVDVLGGRLQFGMFSIATAGSYLKSGKLLALGGTNTTRFPLLPDIPSIAEAGVPGYETTTWYGMFAPAGTPRPILDKINRDVRAVLSSDEIKKRALEAGLELIPNSSADFAAAIQIETERNGKLAPAIGLTKN